MFALDGPEIADAAADIGANILGNFIGNLQPTIVDCFLRSRHRVVNKRAHLARFFFFDVIERIEILYFAGEAAGKPLGIELLDVVSTAATFHQCRPSGFDGITYRRDQSKAGDDDATLQSQKSSRAALRVTE